MIKVLIYTIMIYTITIAQTLPHQVAEALQNNNFDLATELVEKFDAVNSTNTETLDNNFAKDVLHRIEIDFNKTEEQVISQIKKILPDVTQEQIEQWEKAGALEFMVIRGEKRYFARAASNLFLINKEAKTLKEKSQGVKADALENFLLEKIPNLIAEHNTTAHNYLSPQRITITYTLSVKPNVIPSGEAIRCWLPYARFENKRQTDITLLGFTNGGSAIPPIVSPDNFAHKTLYMEQVTALDKPTTFTATYSYTASANYKPIDFNKLYTIDTQGDAYKNFTEESGTHIKFTKRIKELSAKIIGDETNPARKVKRIFEWISNNIPWAGAREYSTLPSIPEYCVINGRGDCGIKTLLFITLCRYNGIPAKWESGWMLHPVEVNLHDWGMFYLDQTGWVSADQSFGVLPSQNQDVQLFFMQGLDSYRLIVNNDISGNLFPAKVFPRSETVDFQRGEVEWRGGNIYFPNWEYSIDIDYKEITDIEK